jgi:Flp pilus assembly protein TadB
MKKVVRFLQIMWLVIAIMSFLIATYHLIFTALEDALYFYFFAGLALILFFVRKRQLKRFDNMSK